MKLDCIGLDRRLIDKKDKPGEKWAVSLVKFPSGDVAEIFFDSKDCVDFNVGAELSLDCGLSVFNRKLGIRCVSLMERVNAGKEK